MEQSFYKRFWLEISLEEAQKKFVYRVNNSFFTFIKEKNWIVSYNTLFQKICYKLWISHENDNYRYIDRIIWWYSYNDLNYITENNFQETLKVIEKVFFLEEEHLLYIWYNLENIINSLLQESINEDWIDLWIIFINWKFLPKWNDKLDKELVEKSMDNLAWLQAEKYYKECLENYLKWNKKWMIEDCFETLEKLSQEILQNEKWLKENKDDLIKYLKSNEIFTSYWINVINQLYLYFNDHRHTKNDKTNENIDENEVEATLYLTWLIINLMSKSNLITNNK